MGDPRKLRIAVWYNLPPGGALRALWYQVRGLLERGHHVEAWRPPFLYGPPKLMAIGDLIAEHEVELHVEQVSQTTYAGRLRNFTSEQRRQFEAMDRHCAECGDQMKRLGFDVLLGNSCYTYNAPFIGRHFDGPKVLYLQEPSRRLYEAGTRSIWRTSLSVPTRASLRSKLSAYFRDYVYVRDLRERAEIDFQNVAAFPRILVNSLFSRESVLRAYNLDSKVCYLGIDASLFETQDAPRKNAVIGLGGIAPAKNIEFVIDSIALIQQDVRPTVRWIGQSAEPAYSTALQNRARAGGVVLELGVSLTDAQLVGALNEAVAFAYAPRLEPFGMAPLEANACGLPVVAVAEGGVRESIVPGLNGYLVERNPAAMAERIAHLIQNPEEAQQMGARAAAHVRNNWTWDRSVDQLERELLEAVCT